MRKRRPAKLILVCLLLGAVINVLMAWTAVIFATERIEERSQRKVTESMVRTWRMYVPSESAGSPEVAFVGVGTFGVETQTMFVFISEATPQVETLNGPRATSFYGLSQLQVGWPLRALETMVLVDSRNDAVQHNIKATRPISFPFNLGTHRLPYGPLWTGLIINTIFYAAVVWLMIRGPIETRRRWRELRGKCGACGYPRGESSVCTECGSDLTHSWGRAAQT